MRETLLVIGLLLVATTLGACTLPSSGPTPPTVELLPSEPAGQRFGASATEAFAHPALRDSVRGLFGRAWDSPGTSGRGLSTAVPEFFTRSAVRSLRIGGETQVAIVGCRRPDCAGHRGLVLAVPDAQRLLARIDDGGFTHYFAFGTGLTPTPEVRAAIDAAWSEVAAAGWAGAGR